MLVRASGAIASRRSLISGWEASKRQAVRRRNSCRSNSPTGRRSCMKPHPAVSIVTTAQTTVAGMPSSSAASATPCESSGSPRPAKLVMCNSLSRDSSGLDPHATMPLANGARCAASAVKRQEFGLLPYAGHYEASSTYNYVLDGETYGIWRSTQGEKRAERPPFRPDSRRNREGQVECPIQRRP
jgi:hypothetical protein